MDNQGFTIAQAAKTLGLSAKTIRRHIKDGKIPHIVVQGKYGEEYRILELPTFLKTEATDSTPSQESPRLDESAPSGSAPQGDAHSVDTTLTWALDIINDLQKTNLQLAGQLGAAQERIHELESRVKLLAMPRDPWWRRLVKIFKRRAS